MHTSIRQIAKIPPSSSQIALKIKSFLTTGLGLAGGSGAAVAA